MKRKLKSLVFLPVMSAAVAFGMDLDVVTYETAGSHAVSEDMHVTNLFVNAVSTIDVAEGVTLSVERLVGSASVVKTGLGTLAVGFMTGTTQIDAREGVVRFVATDTDTRAYAAAAAFHVDASDDASFEYTGEEKDGEPLVQTWRDVRGAGYPVAENGNDKNTDYGGSGNAPVRSFGRQNGLPVVDFLSARQYGGNPPAQLVQDGWGGRLNWNEAIDAREVFVVVADDEYARETQRLRQFFLGNNGINSGYSFWREGTDNMLGDYALSSLRDGFAELDGVACSPTRWFPTGMHLVHMRATESNVHVDCFGKDRHLIWGGQRIGEAIVFTGDGIDGATATNLSWRLRAKWLGLDAVARLTVAAAATIDVASGRTVTAAVYSADGVRTKTGGGTLVVSSFDGVREIAAEEGEVRTAAKTDRLVLPPGVTATVDSAAGEMYLLRADALRKTGDGTLAVQASSATNITVESGSLVIEMQGGELTPAFHLDAAKDSTIAFTDVDEGTVATWSDVRATPADTAYWSARNTGDSQAWFFTDTGKQSPAVLQDPKRRDNALNGLPVMDFLDASRYRGGEPYDFVSGTPNGSARLNWWRGGAKQEMTGICEFFMVYADDDTAYDNNNCTALLGANSSAGISFMRKEGSTQCLFDWDWSAVKAATMSGFEIDGVAKESVVWVSAGKGWHVVHLRINGNGSASAFARQRCQTLGGIKIAETLVYTNLTTDAERDDVYRYLQGKWGIGAAPAAGPRYGRVAVADEASLSLPSGAFIAKLAGGGSLKVKAATIGGTESTVGETTVVHGDVALAESGSVLLVADRPPKAGTYTLLEAESLTGSAARWTVATSPSFRRRSVRLVVDGNALKAIVVPDGFFISIR